MAISALLDWRRLAVTRAPRRVAPRDDEREKCLQYVEFFDIMVNVGKEKYNV